MKKIYVKPIMEMEGFVPNEYVAACWKVECSLAGPNWLDCKYHSITIGGDEYSSDDLGKCVEDLENESVIHAGNSEHIYYENRSFQYEKDGEFYHIGTLDVHHKLKITDVLENDPHPNASN